MNADGPLAEGAKMSRGRHAIPCDAHGRPADIGMRLWSSADTQWAGFPFTVYRLHEHAQIGESFQTSTVLALCMSGDAEMGVQVGTHADRSQSSEGAIAICGYGLEYKSLDWMGTTDVLFLDLDTRSFAEDLEPLSTEAAPMHRFLIQDAHVQALMLAMAAEVREGCASGAIYAQSLSTALAAYVATHYAAAHAALPPGARLSGVQSNRIRDYVEAHIARDISLKELATIAELSASRFSELFKSTFGCAPHQYVIQRRVAEARRLLAEGKLPLAEITHMTGFADQSHFTTVFRRVAHVTPKQYRREHGAVH